MTLTISLNAAAGFKDKPAAPATSKVEAPPAAVKVAPTPPAPAAPAAAIVKPKVPKPVTTTQPKKIAKKPIANPKVDLAAAKSKQNEDQVVAFLETNTSCSQKHAWGRIKDSGYTEVKATARVRSAVNASIKPNSPGCEAWIAKVETKVENKNETTADKSILDKFSESITQPVTEKKCSPAETAMGQCR